jgi:hypothetical protein
VERALFQLLEPSAHGCHRLLDHRSHDGVDWIAWTRKLRCRRPGRPGQRGKRRRQRRRNGCAGRCSSLKRRGSWWPRMKWRRTVPLNDRHGSASMIASSISRVRVRPFLQRWYPVRGHLRSPR